MSAFPGSLLLALTLACGCSGEREGVVRLSLGTTAAPDGVDRMTLTLSAPDIAPRVVPVDLATLTFDLEVSAGDDRTLTVLAETGSDGAWLPWYWGATSFSIAEARSETWSFPQCQPRGSHCSYCGTARRSTARS